MKCDCSLLFLIFKRPETTLKVLEVIRQAQPPRIYVAADGARSDQASEAEQVAKTREIVLNGIDWPCEVKTLFRERNLGCRMAVSSAIDWFFEHEEEGIILEDDCLPDVTFFRFCKKLLEYYRNDTRIMAISGNNFQQGQRRGKYSYYFSQLPHCWGWATWRRAWRLYNISVENFQEIMGENFHCDFTHNFLANKMWKELIFKAYQNNIDSWTYLWLFSNFVNHGLSILPQKNLVENIGFGVNATHTIKDNKRLHISKQSINFPLEHPSCVCLHKEADNFTYSEVYRVKSKKWVVSLLRFFE